jgi:hypothetical protein
MGIGGAISLKYGNAGYKKLLCRMHGSRFQHANLEMPLTHLNRQGEYINLELGKEVLVKNYKSESSEYK